MSKLVLECLDNFYIVKFNDLFIPDDEEQAISMILPDVPGLLRLESDLVVGNIIADSSCCEQGVFTYHDGEMTVCRKLFDEKLKPCISSRTGESHYSIQLSLGLGRDKVKEIEAGNCEIVSSLVDGQIVLFSSMWVPVEKDKPIKLRIGAGGEETTVLLDGEIQVKDVYSDKSYFNGNGTMIYGAGSMRLSRNVYDERIRPELLATGFSDDSSIFKRKAILVSDNYFSDTNLVFCKNMSSCSLLEFKELNIPKNKRDCINISFPGFKGSLDLEGEVIVKSVESLRASSSDEMFSYYNGVIKVCNSIYIEQIRPWRMENEVLPPSAENDHSGEDSIESSQDHEASDSSSVVMSLTEGEAKRLYLSLKCVSEEFGRLQRDSDFESRDFVNVSLISLESFQDALRECFSDNGALLDVLYQSYMDMGYGDWSGSVKVLEEKIEAEVSRRVKEVVSE